MPESKNPKSVFGPKALEMIMRDVLGGLEEFAHMKGFEPRPDVMEIIAIEPPARDETGGPLHPDQQSTGDVICFEQYRRRSA